MELKGYGISLYPHQKEALPKIHNGSVLQGGTGSGKSRTGLAYYYTKICGGDFTENYISPPQKDIPLYIITTPKKRDDGDWINEMAPFAITGTVDSWNNIKKYSEIEDSFFIFDEQRLVGNGAWVKAFYKIAKKNWWIMLSATPGDSYMDYIPLFVANGFYKNRTAFIQEHVVYSNYCKFPKVERFLNTRKLDYFRSKILVPMEFARETIPHDLLIDVDYNKDLYLSVLKRRWNPYKNQPIVNAGELCYTLRHVVNEDPSRAEKVLHMVKEHPRVIVFYNYDYELDILKGIDYGRETIVHEWNGHKHELLPEGIYWVYLVQYNAGAEGWNCITSDTMIFYSDNYSYKLMTQSKGRIDRLNTSFKDLWYFHLVSKAPIDKAVMSALRNKKEFNKKKFVGNYFE